MVHVLFGCAVLGLQLVMPVLLDTAAKLLSLDSLPHSTWTIGILLAAALAWGLTFWLLVPRVLKRAALRSRGLEISARHRAKEDRRAGLELYRQSFVLAVSPERRKSLQAKITALEEAEAANESEEEKATTKEKMPQKTRTPPPTAREPAEATPPPDATLIDPVQALAHEEEERREAVGPAGRYVLNRELGRGGMAVVFHATDEVLGREVALKQLPAKGDSSKEMTERFRQEARALASLSHPNVAQIFDLFEHDDRLWIAMEFVAGGDLADQMDEHGCFSVAEAFEIVIPVACGLAVAHEHGIVHRDIKPMNILIAKDGTPKVTDFGLAKLVRASIHTVCGQVMGSPHYMSPEQAAGKNADVATDMYSLGITLYELLSSHTPFTGDTSQVMAQQITQAPPPLTCSSHDIPQGVQKLVSMMLEKDPAARLSDMNRFIETAERLLREG